MEKIAKMRPLPVHLLNAVLCEIEGLLLAISALNDKATREISPFL